MKTQAWSLKMERVKQVADTAIVGGSAITAPVWMQHLEEVNILVATLTGIVGLIFICSKLYYLIKYHGRVND